MKSSRAIHAELNKVLGVELIAINQYFLHARILKNWGFVELGEAIYDASIDAMKEADELIERVLFLEGLPNLQDLGKINIGQSIPEILGADLALELRLRDTLVAATGACESAQDFVSRGTLAKIQKKSEERVDFLETQRDLLDKMGIQNYSQTAASGELDAD